MDIVQIFLWTLSKLSYGHCPNCLMDIFQRFSYGHCSNFLMNIVQIFLWTLFKLLLTPFPQFR